MNETMIFGEHFPWFFQNLIANLPVQLTFSNFGRKNPIKNKTNCLQWTLRLSQAHKPTNKPHVTLRKRCRNFLYLNLHSKEKSRINLQTLEFECLASYGWQRSSILLSWQHILHTNGHSQRGELKWSLSWKRHRSVWVCICFSRLWFFASKNNKQRKRIRWDLLNWWQTKETPQMSWISQQKIKSLNFFSSFRFSSPTVIICFENVVSATLPVFGC